MTPPLLDQLALRAIATDLDTTDPDVVVRWLADAIAKAERSRPTRVDVPRRSERPRRPTKSRAAPRAEPAPVEPPYVVHVGDCLDVLRTIPASSIDAIVTDPPYGIDFESKRGRFAKIANDKAPFVWWLHDAVRVMRDGAVLVCFCRWDVAEAFRSAIEWAGLSLRGQVVWDRIDHGMGDLTGSPAPCHDTIWIASKGRYRLPGKRPRSIVRHRRVHGRNLEHPNEKPLDLMLDLIRSYVPPASTILDPFAGSGTTGGAAIQLGHRVRLVELDPAYAAITRRRCEEAVAGIARGDEGHQPLPIAKDPGSTVDGKR